MTLNEMEIREHMNDYKRLYQKQHGVKPHSWFGYLQWLSSFTLAHNFNSVQIDLVKELLES